MFKRSGIGAHLLAGILGFGFLAIALTCSSWMGWWTVIPVAGAIVAFRGCPMCWTIGLVEAAFTRRPNAGCHDGSCER